MLALIAAFALAVTGATPSPLSSTPPAPVRTLHLNIPPGWHRTEAGRYNEWRSPDGTANFRVSVMPPSKDYQGPNAAEVVKAQFIQTAATIHPDANVTVVTVLVCNGTQKAYRVDDPLGLGKAGFMMIIPGVTSTGFINYEIMTGKRDPAIMAMLSGLCWP